MNNTTTPRLSYTIDEAAALIGIGRTTLYGLIGKGDLPIVKIGKRTLVRHDDLARLLTPTEKKVA